MASGSYEILNGILWVTGSLDKSTDNDFQQALEQYAKSVSADSRVVDMSNVRWLAPSSAKVLIQAAQEAQEKGGKMRVLSSRHVMQTLNLLGGKTWVTIESATTPTSRPGGGESSPVATVDSPAASGASSTGSAQEPAPAPGGAAPEKADASGAPSAGASAVVSAVRAGGTLASPVEELSGGAYLLRALSANRRYSFHLEGSEQIIGIVRERIGGSWILVDTHGTRKIINLEFVQYCEML
jgi:anti-anti-sigma factor